MIRRCLLLFSLCLLFTNASFAQMFLPGTEDIPLMPDFQIGEEDTFSIDDTDGDGRLLFSKAQTQKGSAEVFEFYQRTLPELGWEETKPGRFEREDDILKISFSADTDNQNSVIFELISK